MAGKLNPGPTDLTRIEIRDICGLWEVVKISHEIDHNMSYPWLSGKFKYNFLPEMIFLCMQNGHNSHGTWELSEKIHDTGKQYSIILNGTFEYLILDIRTDELILSHLGNRYHLVRRL